MTTDKDKKEKILVEEIRGLAGQIGAMQDRLPGSDADNYDYQVNIGLANATTEILDFDYDKVITWFGYCLISCGVEPDARVEALLDSLRREVEAQIDKSEEEDEEGDEEGDKSAP